MKKAVTITKSFRESDQSDKAYYHGLSPRERLESLLELNSPVPPGRREAAAKRIVQSGRRWRGLSFR